MALEEWPIADVPRARVDACALVRADAAYARVRAAAALIRVNAVAGLTDADRARVPTIVEALVAEVERDLRMSILPRMDDAREPELVASLGSATVSIATPRLMTNLPLHPGLLAAALARAEAHRLARRNDLAPPALAGPASAERMALLVAERRRQNRFGEPVLALDDLPPEAAHDLIWTVSAALRVYLGGAGVDAARADMLAIEAGQDRLGRYDEAQGLGAVAARLTQALAAVGALEDATLSAMLDGGELYALHAALAHRANLSADSIWPLLADPGAGRLALLLRAAGVMRGTAAQVLLHFLPASEDPAIELDRFDRCDEVDARDALAVLGQDPAYARALRRLTRSAGA